MVREEAEEGAEEGEVVGGNEVVGREVGAEGQLGREEFHPEPVQ